MINPPFFSFASPASIACNLYLPEPKRKYFEENEKMNKIQTQPHKTQVQRKGCGSRRKVTGNLYPALVQGTERCCLLSHVWLFVTPWTVACQTSLWLGFSRQEYWSGLPFPSPGDLPDPGTEPRSPALQTDSLPFEPQGGILRGQRPLLITFGAAPARFRSWLSSRPSLGSWASYSNFIPLKIRATSWGYVRMKCSKTCEPVCAWHIINAQMWAIILKKKLFICLKISKFLQLLIFPSQVGFERNPRQ